MNKVVRMNLAVVVVLGLIGVVRAADDEIIYSDPLNGAAVTLTGTSPSDRTGGVGTNDWTANNNGNFQANGDVTVGAGTSDGVFLPFVPQAGNVYRLSAEVNTTDGNGNANRWITLGFARANANEAFNSGNVDGYGTMAVREVRGSDNGEFYPGKGLSGLTQYDTTTGSQALEIVLDASDANSANWTMTFFHNGTQIGGPSTAGGTGGDYGDIAYVGFTRLTGANGTVSNFQLSIVPEPGPNVIYLDPLNGTDGTLTGSAPGDRIGGKGTDVWTANDNGNFQANGDVTLGAGASDGVFLPFAPQAGNVYRLSAEVDTINGPSNPQKWITLGFARANANGAYYFSTVDGYGTMAVREDRGAGEGEYAPGKGTTGNAAYDTTAGSQALEIVLDASDAGSGNWTMTFFNNGALVGGPSTAGGTGGNYGTIAYVGFTRLNGANGTVSNFELSIVPPRGTVISIR